MQEFEDIGFLFRQPHLAAIGLQQLGGGMKSIGPDAHRRVLGGCMVIVDGVQPRQQRRKAEGLGQAFLAGLRIGVGDQQSGAA